MVKSSPILMSSPMVKAYMAGLKSQTRRVRGLAKINQDPDQYKLIDVGILERAYKSRHVGKFGAFFELPKHLWIADDKPRHEFIPAPYGGAGDTLWFRETFGLICNAAVDYCTCETAEEEKENHSIEYRADTDNKYPGEWPEEEARGCDYAPKWRPSIFMKKIHCRFQDIPIVSVRIERLQSIAREDAKAEGVSHVWEWNKDRDPKYYERGLLNPYVANYSVLWDEINGESLPWDKNPWVWVYSFPKFEAVRS